MLFNETRQYNIQMFNKIIFLKYRTKEIKAIECVFLVKIKTNLNCLNYIIPFFNLLPL